MKLTYPRSRMAYDALVTADRSICRAMQILRNSGGDTTCDPVLHPSEHEALLAEIVWAERFIALAKEMVDK